MSIHTSQRSTGEHNGFIDLVFALLVIAIVMAAIAGLVCWAGAAAAAWLTGHRIPDATFDPRQAVSYWANPSHAWGQPMPGPGTVWTATALVAAVTIACALAAWRPMRNLWAAATNSGSSSSGSSVLSLPGTATPADVRRVASRRALMRRARGLRPSLPHPRAADVGHRLGRARGVDVWSTVEDSQLVVGPPRSGKGLHVVINAILDAPGACVTTSTRPDSLTVTLKARQRLGPVAVFDPQQLAAGVPAGLRWSPVRGCENPQTAMIRAAGFAAGTGLATGGVENGGFWQGQTEAVVRGLLHAAALDGRTAADVYRWSIQPPMATEAVTILSDHPDAAAGWADALDAAASGDPRTRDNVWLGVRQAFAALADPRVLDAVTPGEGDGFDPEAFLAENGTLYLLGTATGSNQVGSLVAAFVEDMVETGRRLAAASPGARLDPPAEFALDEIGNLSPLPSLPALMSEGGGSGLATLAVVQSMAQARHKWGEQAAGTIWDAAIVKLILGGNSNARDLADWSALIGDRDDHTTTWTRGHRGERSQSTSVRRVPILPPGQLRTLPFGTAVLLLRSAAPIVVDLPRWLDRSNSSQLRADRKEIEQQLHTAAAAAMAQRANGG